MTRHIIAGLPPSMSPSSHAVETDGFVFLTGQFGRNLSDPEQSLPEGIIAQTEQTLSNMSHVLGQLGLSFEDVVSVRVYLTHFKRDYNDMNETYAQFFADGMRPVRTCVGVTELVRDALIEIDCIAKR
ncbi:RidA family protein [Methylobacterium sp. NMS14P]|uniref:RidA family protein n=1 Tax=Methylobacterium sp. NMS14P TaxID=2894310 RepID=UPI00235924CD|nr:RidA family protein [Methylobacterium sp. NMS14P]WCS28351.1 RidA family protein [Methylobacterium sp. NMS14P]